MRKSLKLLEVIALWKFALGRDSPCRIANTCAYPASTDEVKIQAMVLSGNTGHFYLKRLVTFGSERRTEFEIINTTEVLRAIWLEIAASL